MLTRACFAANIGKSPDGITGDMLNEYINDFRMITEGLSGIWNYDDSDLTDDPGRKKILLYTFKVV